MSTRSGPPGIGKSTACKLLAEEAKLRVIEYNASDARNKKSVEEIAGTADSCANTHGE